MATNIYATNVIQSNGCRIWRNPKAGNEIPVPETKPMELYISNIPRELLEEDLLPHFERFGPIYQFRLLMDYDNLNRGFGYLTFFWEKSARQALDLMGYYIMETGIFLDVEVSLEKSHLMALNVPWCLSNEQIEDGFRSIFPNLSRVQRELNNNHNQAISSSRNVTCSVIIEFSDHQSALMAKQFSSLGSINLWNRNVKIIWAHSNLVSKSNEVANQVKNLMFCNMPIDFDPDDLGNLMCDYVCPQEIICITPLENEYFVEFSNPEAANAILNIMNGKVIDNHRVSIQWVPNSCHVLSTCADFVFELRALCLANYWDPPIFIYGRVIPSTKIQLCAVIIKNNRKNLYATFFIEINYEDLVEIHSRVCEAIVRVIMEFYELPRRNLVLKVFRDYVYVGK
jgi:RNA recognition motif-containing protein